MADGGTVAGYRREVAAKKAPKFDDAQLVSAGDLRTLHAHTMSDDTRDAFEKALRLSEHFRGLANAIANGHLQHCDEVNEAWRRSEHILDAAKLETFALIFATQRASMHGGDVRSWLEGQYPRLATKLTPEHNTALLACVRKGRVSWKLIERALAQVTGRRRSGTALREDFARWKRQTAKA